MSVENGAVCLLSEAETTKLEVIEMLMSKEIGMEAAVKCLCLGPRQIRRLVQAVRQRGVTGIRHGLKGRPSNRCLPPARVEEALRLVREQYPDFSIAHATEMLVERQGITISRSALRQHMIRAGLCVSRTRPPSGVREERQRRSRVGELVQIDGSLHPWLEDRVPKFTLLLFVDDATSRILWGKFVEREDALSYFSAMRGYLESHGVPLAIYVDWHTVFRPNRWIRAGRRSLSQFGRAMQELGIEVIFAGTPQAKGRVERAFRTCQDRLVKEMRLEGIRTMEEANGFLPRYITEHNRRFAVDPAGPENAHRPAPAASELDGILCVRKMVTLSPTLTVQINGVHHLIQPAPGSPIRPEDKLIVEIRPDGITRIRWGSEYVSFVRVEPEKGSFLAVQIRHGASLNLFPGEI